MSIIAHCLGEKREVFFMKFNQYAYIFIGVGMDEKKHRTVFKSDQNTCIMVGLDPSNKARVVELAKELVAEGVQMIELCGGFGPLWVAKVLEALKGSVPVGGVYYGPEARQQLVDLGLGQCVKF